MFCVFYYSKIWQSAKSFNLKFDRTIKLLSLLLYDFIYVFYTKNNEPWNWFVTAKLKVIPGKVGTKFCKCLHLDFKQAIFEFFKQFEAKMTVLEIRFLGLENVKKNWIQLF